MRDGFLDDIPDVTLGENNRRVKKKPAGPDRPPPKVVIYHIVHCPVCKSTNVPVYSTEKPIRYHKCSDCGHNFKSIEK